MANNEQDIKKNFEDEYNDAIGLWNPALKEMHTDVEYYLGNQWSEQEKKYLNEEGRNAFVYNYCQRNVHLNSGYQRKNRLGFGVAPQQTSDEEISDYLQDGLIWQANKCDFYNKFSDGFEDASISGMSLMTFGMDYSRDLVNGRVICDIEPFQSVIIDPLFSKIDLSDCRYILKRKYISKDQAKGLLPSAARDIDKLKPGRTDNKFDYMSFSRTRMAERDLVAYDEQYRRTTKKVKVLTHRFTGEQIFWKGTKANLDILLSQYPVFDVSTIEQPTIEYNVLIQNEPMFSGKDPLGIEDFPCVPILWVYKPQFEDFKYKIQGMIRPVRDPQNEYNRKRSKISDILDSQASVGWVVEKGAVTNEEELFKTGQGQVIKTEKGRLNSLREKQSVDIPAGLVQLVQLLTTDLIQIPGLNEEALGVAEGGNTEVSGTLAKQRAANSITIFQTVYDKLALSQKQCGIKLLQIMLANFTPEKWQSITEKPFPENINVEKLMDFDIVVKETQLTDTQKILGFYQGMEAKKAGLPIPDQFLIEEMPTANKTRLKELYAEQAQAAQQQQEQANKLEMLKLQSELELVDANSKAATGLGHERNSRVLSNIGQLFGNMGLYQERRVEAQKDLEQATLDKIKSIKELQGMNLDQIEQALQIIEGFKQRESAEGQTGVQPEDIIQGVGASQQAEGLSNANSAE